MIWLLESFPLPPSLLSESSTATPNKTQKKRQPDEYLKKIVENIVLSDMQKCFLQCPYLQILYCTGKEDLMAYALCFLILFECWQLFAKVLRAATAIDREGGRGREKQKLILNIKFIALTLLFQTPH